MCRKTLVLYLGALLVLGGVAAGCGDDDDTPVDAGRDSGPTADASFDAGFDAGDECVPDCTDLECGDDGCGGSCGECAGGLACGDDGTCPATVFARLAHLVPNGGNMRLCVYLSAGGTPVGAPVGPLLPETPTAGDVDYFPFRGVSSYTDLFTADPVTYQMKFYSADDVTTACPAVDATTPAVLLDDSIDGSSLSPGQFYTIAAVGFAPESDGSAPMYCGATRDAECTGDALAHIEVYDDDPTPPATAGETKVRFLQGIPNMNTAIDICYDPDTSVDGDSVELFNDIAYPAASDYFDTAAMTTGAITVHLNIPGVTDGMTCPAIDIAALGINTQIATIPLPWPFPGGEVPEGAVTVFDADQVATIMGSGNAAVGATDPTQVSFVPWADAIP